MVRRLMEIVRDAPSVVMMPPCERVSAGVARAVIAAAVLGDEDVGARAMGHITLRPHQRSAVERLRRAIERFGGALLADDVGLGKTYVAAALAREANRPLIVAPAALRGMWETAAAQCALNADFTSYEALSRGRRCRADHDLLVLDEAHHARNPGTARYRRLATLAERARVLLLSATPIHNSRADLRALLALFLGARAGTLDDADLARCIIRRERVDLQSSDAIPDVAMPRWIHVPDDEALLRDLLAIPAPLPPRDGGDAGALLLVGLLQQWASSHAALAAAIGRRRAAAGALIAALERGRRPTRAELSAWPFAEGALQLAFPEIVAGADPDAATLLPIIRVHDDALRRVRAGLRLPSSLDALRAERLRETRALHPGEKVIAFAQFAETVRAYFHHLRSDPGIAALTARGGVVAGGRLSRAEVLRRFTPASVGAAAPRAADRVDLLLTTDLLSEGVDLREASVVVHLDLPWTAARLEQRVGRARRLGAAHARVAVLAMHPPAAAESLLRVEQRLREKLRAARRVVGVAGTVLPEAVEAHPPGVAQVDAALRRLLARWRSSSEGSSRQTGRPVVSVVETSQRGALALVREDGEHVPIASMDGAAFTPDLPTVLAVARLADAQREDRGWVTGGVQAAAVTQAMEGASRWMQERAAARLLGSSPAADSRSRRRALRRIAAIAARAPPHRRPALAPLVAAAIEAMTATFGAATEQKLAELAPSALPDETWLRSLADLARAHGRAAPASEPYATGIVAVMVFV